MMYQYIVECQQQQRGYRHPDEPRSPEVWVMPIAAKHLTKDDVGKTLWGRRRHVHIPDGYIHRVIPIRWAWVFGAEQFEITDVVWNEHHQETELSLQNAGGLILDAEHTIILGFDPDAPRAAGNSAISREDPPGYENWESPWT